MGWYGVIAVLLYSVISTSKCCISFSSGGCSLSYGGRLTFRGYVSHPLLFGPGGRKRIFILQQPPDIRRKGWGHTKYFPGSSGKGHIWTGNGQCRVSQAGQSLCPMSEDRPCLDSKKPCDATPPSYSNEAPLQFSEVKPTSILVKWPAWDENIDLGFGPFETYIIQFRKKGERNFQGIRKGFSLSHRFVNLEQCTQYEFRLIIVRDHPHGEGPPSEIQPQSTPRQVARYADLGVSTMRGYLKDATLNSNLIVRA